MIKQHNTVSTVARFIVLTALMGLIVIAQGAPAMPNAHYQKVSERLDELKSQIAITSDEEPLWQSYRQSVLENVATNDNSLIDENKQDKYTAPEYFAARLKRIDDLSHHLHLITERFNALYTHLTSEQKSIADRYFENRRQTLRTSR